MKKEKNMAIKISNKKKLVSATAMLLVSALMLGLTTYAWFTMSKELEVTGIKMTAATPKGVQISLGALTGGALSDSKGIITGATAANPAVDSDWSNKADVSKYYSFGKLFPASSVNGANIFYTGDATGVGRTLKDGAVFATPDPDSQVAKLHAYTSTEKTDTALTPSWTPEPALDFTTTNDDGYYVDIPVWFRTSDSAGVKLTVEGYVTNSSDANSNDDIYEATRVAVLNADLSANQGIVDLKKATAFGTGNDSIIDSYNYYSRQGGSGDPKAVSATSPSWANVDKVISSGDDKENVVDLTGASYKGTTDGSNGGYGGALKKIIRVWIEGEDKECYNPNAAETFRIALKFK
ncbi:hypothetical protein [Eubacterium xylanophilum]|uniref:hypothetical protein n=1 Tax=Eubacterium xylanophilum TaxID=39497 RepID=UPI00047AE840|nr:hypothetical protein [Eubacterium xylanophilum]